MYAESHWRYHTFERYYTCSCSKLRHKAHQKVWKCSLVFPLKNGIVISYENCTNKYGRVEKLRGWYPPLGTYIGYLMYNFVMVWAIIAIYTSKCVQMYPQQLSKTSKLYSRCKKCDMQKTVTGEVVPTPWVAWRFMCIITYSCVRNGIEKPAI